MQVIVTLSKVEFAFWCGERWDVDASWPPFIEAATTAIHADHGEDVNVTTTRLSQDMKL